MRVVQATGYREPRDALSHDWIDWAAARGHLAIPVPNRLRDPAGYLDELGVEALVLTGGNDLVPRPGAPDDTSPERTATEQALLAHAIASGRPVLGVCRGLHVVNRHFGGDVIDDIGAGPVPHVARDHTLRLSDDFGALAGDARIRTNSFHAQAVGEDGVGKGLEIFAVSPEDRIVEGLHHCERPVLAVQWHPERQNPATAFDDVIIGRLFTEGAFWRP